MNPPTPATPAIVSQAAVRRLPRLALILFCAAYVLPGFLGREPWKDADVTAFGVMLEMAAGRSSWWQPQLLGLAVDESGPLPYWLGAVAIELLPFFSSHLAARIPFALLLALTLACTWYAVYHLARQPAAQPVSFAFGGEARPADYARALADAGLLALLACLGLAQLAHETTPDLVRLSLVALMLYAAARLAHQTERQPVHALAAWGLAALGLTLSGGIWLSAVLGSGLLGAIWLARRRSRHQAIEVNPTPPELLYWSAGVLLLVVASAIGAGLAALPQPRIDFSPEHWMRWARLLLWFSWPAWPLVLWTLWRWRRQLLEPHLALPLWVALVGVALSALSNERDRALLLALPALAALAAFALPTLRRSMAALIDWFTLVFFTACAFIIWVIWLAIQTGVPARPAANVARLAPNFVHEFSWLLFVPAALASAAWLGLVAWRMWRHRDQIWKSLVLPAAGSTLCWLLLMTLWLPLLDFGLSYGPAVRRIAALVPPQSCVLVKGLSPAQIAALQYHGGLDLRRSKGSAATPCLTLVLAPAQRDMLVQRSDYRQWTYVSTVGRRNDDRERLLVYRRASD